MSSGVSSMRPTNLPEGDRNRAIGLRLGMIEVSFVGWQVHHGITALLVAFGDKWLYFLVVLASEPPFVTKRLE